MHDVVLPIVAVGAGLLSFISPCALPLIPGYLSYVSAVPVAGLGAKGARIVVLRAALRFVAGFTAVFALLGVSVSFLGTALLQAIPGVVRILGIVIIVMGLAMAGLLRAPWLQRERRFDLSRISAGPRGAALLGVAFAFGWVPCVGPILAVLLTLAASGHTAAWGGLLLVLYSLGLGLPFVALAVGFQRWRTSLRWLQGHGRVVELIGGLFLMAMGVLFVTGEWRTLFVPLQTQFARAGWLSWL